MVRKEEVERRDQRELPYEEIPAARRGDGYLGAF
jgi:hypothetical protein